MGLFREIGDGAFVLTPVGQALRKDATGSAHGMALLYGEEWLWQAYGRMHHSVSTGQPAFEQVHGEALFDYLSANPDAAAVFNAAMSSFSGQEAEAIIAAYDFSDVRRVIDVGGGEAALMTAILRHYPDISGMVFDLEPVVPGGRRQAHGRRAGDAQPVHRRRFLRVRALQRRCLCAEERHP